MFPYTVRTTAAILLGVGLSLTVLAAAGSSRRLGYEAIKSSLAPYVELSGADSHMDQLAYHRVTTAEEFQAMFMRHLGQDPAGFDPFYNRHGVPSIDFDRCMVVAIFQGEKWNSAGVSFTSVTEEADRIVFRFDDRSFQTAGPAPEGGRVRARPYGIFVLPRSDKALVLEENIQHLKNEPPKGMEVARFKPLA